MSVLASTSCVRGQSVSVGDQVGDWFDPKSFSAMFLRWLVLGCVVVFLLTRLILLRRKAWGASEESCCVVEGVSPVEECDVSRVEKQLLRLIKRSVLAALATSRRVGRSRVRSPRLGYRRVARLKCMEQQLQRGWLSVSLGRELKRVEYALADWGRWSRCLQLAKRKFVGCCGGYEEVKAIDVGLGVGYDCDDECDRKVGDQVGLLGGGPKVDVVQKLASVEQWCV